MSASVTVTVARVRGSAPREQGARMQVFATHQAGSIGGGALEWEALKLARQMLREGRTRDERTYPLGPALGQCCGGAVTLRFEDSAENQAPKAAPLVIWGAGHVGRALAQVFAPLEDREITLVDDARARLPEELPEGIAPFVAQDMPRAAALMPAGADHLIVTYSHEIDLALCDALLQLQVGSIGLIGSATKWARFQKRLSEMGYEDAEISRITCPIGDPAMGKHPQAIAISVASDLLMRASAQLPAQRSTA